MPSISVIVPVYQAEAYLQGCIESVKSQTFTDWELLLIDDGSRDGSPAICDRSAAEDPRIRAFHKPNGGVSTARNLGLQEARGEYIAFLDSDDRFVPARWRLSGACAVRPERILLAAPIRICSRTAARVSNCCCRRAFMTRRGSGRRSSIRCWATA